MTDVTGFAEPPVAPGTVVVAGDGLGRYSQQLLDGHHKLTADEPISVGGGDAGPGPYELLLMSLGACTSMTLRMYADQHGWPLERVIVRLKHDRVYAKDCAECETKAGMLDRIDREIELQGVLDEAQTLRLMQIADKCPVHRTLIEQVKITTRRTETSPAVAPVGGTV
jgi:putative redox protein